MNVFKFEIKKTWITSIAWIVAIIGTFLLFIYIAYPFFQDGSDEILVIINSFPQEYLKVMGFNMDMFFGYIPFYSFTFLYIGLMFVIMCLIITISIFSREKRAKCTEFMLTRPLNRREIFISKFFACFLLLLVVNIIYGICVLINMNQNIEDFKLTKNILLILLAPLFTQLFFMSIGIFLSVYLKRIRSVSGLSAGVGIGIFLLSSIVNIVGKEWLYVIAPLEYFNPKCIVEKGYYRFDLVLTSSIIFVILIVISYIKFCKEDTKSI